MSEETEQKEEEVEVEYSPDEAKARESGWSPLEEWRGDEADWVTAERFNDRGEFMSRIAEQSSIIAHLTNKVEDRDTAMQDVLKLQEKMADRAYTEALKTLKDQKKEALESDDYDAIVNIDEEMNELKEHKPKPIEAETKPEVKAAEVPKEIVDWLSAPAQSWYHNDAFLRGTSEGIAGVLQAENPNISPTDLIRRVDATMREKLPQYFKSNSADVDTGGEFNGQKGTRSGGRTPTFSQLDEEQQAVCRRFEKTGTMSRKDYIKSLVELGEL